MDTPLLGFSHLQLRVRDVAASCEWYSTVLGIETLETRQTPSGFGSIGHALQSVMHQISHIQASLASQLAIDHISLGHAPVNGQAIHGNIPQSVIDHLFS